ncbi:MAG: hypothetical protein WD045_10995 [Pirellulaceae bacterium]
MMIRSAAMLVATVLFGLPQFADAGLRGHGAGCNTGCQTSAPCAPSCQPTCAPAPCEVQYVEKTVMVPQRSWEVKTVTCTVNRPEMRERTVQVCRRVPETNYVTKQYTVTVPEWQSKTVDYTVSKPVYETKTTTKTVMVPHYEEREATRQVCKMVPTTVTKTVCKDHGTWETKCGVDRCGCPTTCKVWVPNVVQEEVECTVMKPVMEAQPYTYKVCVMKPEEREHTYQVCNMVTETRQKEVRHMVCRQEVREKQVACTTYKTVMEDKVVPYCVMVPTQVTKEVRVPVCNMVPKTIQVPVRNCAPCVACR